MEEGGGDFRDLGLGLEILRLGLIGSNGIGVDWRLGRRSGCWKL